MRRDVLAVLAAAAVGAVIGLVLLAVLVGAVALLATDTLTYLIGA
ncbi:hypothetical protein CLV28_0721 [Sediminihabitans luteus]|uniref:Uncharacterized protein n=1 Tax=Sediminihabitans luteus TaxID=1138585 RepID=A0A2M9CZZ1_9CELL|nr:hypothetical protein [Sediminihabitans luteus]PJJ77502.1 hypothetical protein CLV28_0721 [Sediminihabitans luteus]GII98399.1 hypothetical protein Slu03_07770 [Sediminihabitans luteus]